ncbi:hypothetical protein V8C26DRAFT_408863 [Trichoderma gracile]
MHRGEGWKMRVASALQQTSIRRHILVRLGAHLHIHALFPVGIPLSNLAVSAPTPLAPIHDGGEAC